MANENENIIHEGAGNPEEPKHSTWKDIVKEEFQKLDTDFPLSGAETEEDFKLADEQEEGEQAAETEQVGETTANEVVEPAAGSHEGPGEHHSFIDNLIHKIQNLDTEFPLSGGESEEDFEAADDAEEDEEPEEGK